MFRVIFDNTAVRYGLKDFYKDDIIFCHLLMSVLGQAYLISFGLCSQPFQYFFDILDIELCHVCFSRFYTQYHTGGVINAIIAHDSP